MHFRYRRRERIDLDQCRSACALGYCAGYGWREAERPRLDRDDEAIKTLGLVGLSHMVRRLDNSAHWTQILSPGKQQRIAIARALLLKLDWLFLDEVTPRA